METYGYDLDDAINKVLSENGLGINNIEISILESDASLLDKNNNKVDKASKRILYKK